MIVARDDKQLFHHKLISTNIHSVKATTIYKKEKHLTLRLCSLLHSSQSKLNSSTKRTLKNCDKY